jgi:ABC-type enterochelin transport system permease subunit
MKKNVGTLDRSIRFVAAAVLAILYFTGVVSGTLGIVALVLAVVLLLTGTFRFCGLYIPFHMSTCKTEPSS